jgi:hypothetical protein
MAVIGEVVDPELARGVEEGKKLAARTDAALTRLFAAQSLQKWTGLLYNDR